MSTHLISFSFFLAFAISVLAQDTSIIYPTTAAVSAAPLQTGSGYNYVGCWNETTGIAHSGGERALTGGTSSANNTMRVGDCLHYCSKGYNGRTMQYAGLEYGRECYCGAYLSALSESLSSSKCNLACNGNVSQICGGSLAISLYNLTSGSKTSIAWSVVSNQPLWYLTAAIAMLGVAAIL